MILLLRFAELRGAVKEDKYVVVELAQKLEVLA